MAKGVYIGINGVARKVKAIYIGVDGVCRQFWPYVVEARTDNTSLISSASSSLNWDYRHYDLGTSTSGDETNTLVNDNITKLSSLSLTYSSAGDHGFIVLDSKIDFNGYKYIYVSITITSSLNWSMRVALSSSKTTQPNTSAIYIFKPDSYKDLDPSTSKTIKVRCALPSIEECSAYLKAGIYVSGASGTTTFTVNYIVLSNNTSAYTYDQAVSPE